ncbi:hypothetical protein CCYA_CCYA08G2259 [Cyanidiococcus yangmingshanensis]|nr:hypothetical protein CCYA_CCYA08G2259 [Cyanidiococcus yangmingshanensis]
MEAPSSLSKEAVLQLTVVQLRRELAARGAPVGGRKLELQQRLLACTASANTEETQTISETTSAGQDALVDASRSVPEPVEREAPSNAERSTKTARSELTCSSLDTGSVDRATASTAARASASPEANQVPEQPAVLRRKRRWQAANDEEAASALKKALVEPVPMASERHGQVDAADKIASDRVASSNVANVAESEIVGVEARTWPPEEQRPVASSITLRTPFMLLDRCVTDATPCLVSCRHNKKLYGTLRAYDKHFNLIMEHVREIWQESKPDNSVDLRERFIPRLFVRGDGVIFIVRPGFMGFSEDETHRG